jgi:ribonuclease J
MICTGSQGESNSALVKIASGEHPYIKMNSDDLVLFSSRVIPGNEKSIGNLHSMLARVNADIITSSEENIHSSGHPARSSIKKMYELLRPKIVVPVHGEARHVIAQSHFARKLGIEHVITPNNGAVIQLAGESPSLIGHVASGIWAVDGKRMVSFDGLIINERTLLAEQGAVFATIIAEKNGIKKVDINFIGLVEKGQACEMLGKSIISALKSLFTYEISDSNENIDAAIQKIRLTIHSKIGKKPFVEVHSVMV